MPKPKPPLLRDDAIAIWQAGVAAVHSETLVRRAIQRDGETLLICGERWPLSHAGRIAVVGAGKAGAGMAAGFETAVGNDLLGRVTGWVNVPDDCVRPLRKIHLHPSRPAGMNVPTLAGVAGAEAILQIVADLTPHDVCLVLLSGGGSALLPAPVPGVPLEDQQALTRGLSSAGASINELNCVRKHLSRIKGGRLADSCNAGTLIGIIISDVIGDPLDVIASGPTTPDTSTAAEALAVVASYADRVDVPPSVMRHLSKLSEAKSSGGRVRSAADGPASGGRVSSAASGGRVRSAADGPASAPPRHPLDQTRPPDRRPPSARNYVIGNIDVALKAAAEEARRRGYDVQSLGGANTGIATGVGVELAERCLSLRDSAERPTCLLSGGEPTVHLVPTDRQRSGGRNQELILAAARRLWNENLTGLALLSGGTDGEDGPTDAAGAFVDVDVLRRAQALGLDPSEFLAINNSYEFFARAGGHLKTGPTHTNVMDLRVGLVR